MNVENLRKLANYLKGQLKAAFDMDVYTKESWERDDCGTGGCAAGHGPYAGIIKANESWTSYVTRAFGLHVSDPARSWCFSSQWCNTDNTPLGAAKRIEWLLEHGVPENWREQITRKEPLCYEL